MKTRECIQSDLERVCEILDSYELPTKDIHNIDLSGFYVAEIENTVIGVGGIEEKGPIALIRSIAVDRKFAGRGIGKIIYEKIEQYAFSNGIIRLYLLTTTASQYFVNLGYEILDRNLSPVPIKSSEQFNNLCPASAILMHKSLSQVQSKTEFDSGLYCAESVLSTIAEHFDIKSDLIPKIATGFCSGMARTCGTCGAVTGAILAINMISGRESASNSVEHNYDSVQKLVNEFEKMYGSTNCQELLNCNLGDENGQIEFKAQELHNKCREYTGMAADLAASIISSERYKL